MRSEWDMRPGAWRAGSKLLVLSVGITCSTVAYGQLVGSQRDAPIIDTENTSAALLKLDQLVEQNHLLEEQNRALMTEIEALRGVLAQHDVATNKIAEAETEAAVAAMNSRPTEVQPQAAANLSEGQSQPKIWGTYTPNQGFKLANTEYGDLNL